MPVYSVYGSLTVGATAHTAVSLIAAATPRRMKIFDINMAASGSPNSTDCAITYNLTRCTFATAGTSTGAATIAPIDAADAAATSTSFQGYSAEPTVIGNALLTIGMNQRAPYRWQTYLGSGAELVTPNTASNGVVFQIGSAGGYTNAAGATIYYQE